MGGPQVTVDPEGVISRLVDIKGIEDEKRKGEVGIRE